MNLILRIVSAAVLLPLAIAALYMGQLSAFALLFVVIAFSYFEYLHLVTSWSFAKRLLFTAFALAFCVKLVFWDAIAPNASLVFMALGSVFFLAYLTLSTHLQKEDMQALFGAFFGVAYVVLGLMSFYFLRLLQEADAPSLGLSFVLLALVATWSNDTCAYFAGRLFGKHPLFPAVSAKKTWEGFVGGALGSLLVPVALRALFLNFQIDIFEGLQLSDILWIACPSIVLAPLGDLCESRLKRLANVKDSGSVLPGHGGFLDRVDALLVMGPWTLCYASLIRIMC